MRAHIPKPWDMYPNIIATFGFDWLYKRAGQLTDNELLRQEEFLAARAALAAAKGEQA